MSALKMFCLALIATCALGGTAGLSLAQALAPTGSASRTQYVYDRFGNLQCARMLIRLNNGHVWRFDLPRRFLDLPVAVQLAALDRRFRLAADRNIVGLVLQGLQQARVQQGQQRQQQQIQSNLDRMNQFRQQQDQINRMNQLQQQQWQRQQALQRQLDQMNRINQLQQQWQRQQNLQRQLNQMNPFQRR
jgi:hypothetical protein